MNLLILSLVSLLSAPPVPNQVDIKLSQEGHTAVFLTAEEQEIVQRRIEHSPWAAPIVKNAFDYAKDLITTELDIPHAGGQWSHWYTCKEDGGRLRAESPTRHVCKSCGEVYTGFPYDEVYITYRHGFWLQGVEKLGTAYAFQPKAAYAERVRAILLDYASFYESLPIHNFQGKVSAKGARLYAQTLDESVALCSLIFGYDLVYDADCFTPADHETIAQHLLRPMVACILRYKTGKSNWQSWHNGAIAATGFLLRDEAMVDFAINDPKHGFLFQMRESVLPSGMWYEGAPSYHWYSMNAHIYLLEAAARAGIDLYALPVVRSLFVGPTTPLFPDMTYPAINDSSRSSIRGAAPYYEVAFRRYGDSNFLALREPRHSPRALLWGKDAPEGAVASKLVLETSNDKEGGMAILRDPAHDAALFFNYNPGKSGHTHPAKLDIILYANGDERIVDPGRLSYGNPLHGGWYTQTVAHNTVVVDEKTQKRASGVFRAFEVGDDWSLVRAGLEAAYKGVSMERTLFMRDGVIVDQFRCVSEEEHTYDLPLHFNGALQEIGAGEAVVLGDKGGYQHVKALQQLNVAPPAFLVDTGEGTSIHVSVFDGSDVFVGEGRAQPATRYIPMVLRRQQGKTATFTTVYQLLGKGEAPRDVTAQLGAETRITFGDTVFVVAPGRAVLHISDGVVFDG